MRAGCVAFTGVGEVALRDFEFPAPEPGEFLVRTRVSAVSPGTEGRTLAGLQAGAAAWPIIPGYSLCGTTEGGERVYARGTERADLGLTWGGHVEWAVVSEAKAIPVDSRLSDGAAGMGHLLGIAYRGLRLAEVLPGERVLVVGLGPIGALSARLFRAAGAEVLAVDRNPERVAQDAATGGRARVLEGDLAEVAGEADVVVDATGVASALAASARALRIPLWTGSAGRPGRLVVQGSYPGEVALPYDDLFRREARVVFPRDARREDVVDAFALVAEGRLAVDDLAPEADPADAPAVYAALREGRRIGAAFRWR